jgi:hypothetical protein
MVAVSVTDTVTVMVEGSGLRAEADSVLDV